MPENTQRVDDCECIYCHHVFDGREACNGDMDRRGDERLWIIKYACTKQRN